MSASRVERNAAVLAEHSSFTWNKSETRIRCNAPSCGTIMDADGADSAITAFALHQAQQLPSGIVLPNAPASGPETEPEPEAVTEPEPEETPEPAPAGPDAAAAPDTDTEPEDPAMTTATLARRNVKELTAALESIKKGDRVTAVFSTPRYGHFEVTGTVIKGGAGQDREQLIVAGWLLNTKTKPNKALQELTLVAAAGEHDYPVVPGSNAPEHIGIG